MVSQIDGPWTNKEILHKFLWRVLEHIRRVAGGSVEVVRDAASLENPKRLEDRLVALQSAVVLMIFSYIDGTSGPSEWPGIKLVNAETGETLSENLASSLSNVESDFLDQFG